MKKLPNIRHLPVQRRWCLHSYYTLCPYAPDGSGRILLAGADLESNKAEIYILSPNGEILNSFGSVPATTSFWHTALWQSWSPDARTVYYQSGSLMNPSVTRHELATGNEVTIEGDVEGMPPFGEPAFSCSHSMLYAAGYGGNGYQPENSPVPFQLRDSHGISRIRFDLPQAELILSTQDIFDRHPLRDRIRAADLEIKQRLGESEGLTLMTYCVRWNSDGSRCLFFWGNHCVARERGEPKIMSVFTADRNLKELHHALDFSFDRYGVHWGWQSDNEHLIGYGQDPDNPSRLCMAEVHYDGTGYRKLCDHTKGGHPSTSPVDPNLIVTDEYSETGGNVLFFSKRTGEVIQSHALPKFIGEKEPPGRNPLRICHHPVFNYTGDRVLCNILPDKYATLIEIQVPEA